MTRLDIENWFQDLQNTICQEIEKADGVGKFEEDQWLRAEGGGGKSRIMRNGAVLEKAGVNFSAVHGVTPPNILRALQLDQAEFYATGISIVIHPVSPMVPIIHMNTRYFEMSNGVYWFGGGIDLTPHYVVDEDAQYFHNQLKTVCDHYDEQYYTKFKNWADDYFYIKHRQETRGVGGIFFDRLSEDATKTKEQLFEFVKAVGQLFAPTYTYLMDKNKDLPYTENELKWQALRRSRYVEFNLVYDKGTKFGLDTDGRTESILMSMPPMAKWEYNFQPEQNSAEAITNSKLTKGKNWL